MQLSISVNELERHTLTSAKMYWLVRRTAPHKCAGIALNVAEVCRQAGYPLQTLACLRVASRLGGDPSTIDSRIAELEEKVERESPIDSLLPESFSYISCQSAEYERLIDAGGFSRALLPLRNTPLTIGAFMTSKEITDRGIHRLDFILVRKGVPVSRVEAVVALDRGVTEWDNPVRIQFAPDAPPSRRYQIAALTLDVLKALAVRHGACDIQVDDIEHGTMQTVVGRATAIRDYLPELRAAPFVDLTQDNDAIWSGIRDSYRALIRTQGRALSLRYYGHRDQDVSVIDAWRGLLEARKQLKARVFDFEVSRARQGQAEVAGAFLSDGQCCSVTTIIDDGPMSEYRIGYYIKDDSGRESSHHPVYDSILRAKERGQTRFYFSYFGDTTAYYGLQGELVTLSSKGRALHFFKRGFSNTIERKYVFRLVI